MWHVLALALGGRTVAEWQRAMTIEEFKDWMEFYERHPFDDFNRYHRPAALVAQSMTGGGAEALQEKLDWLQPSDGLMQRSEIEDHHKPFFKAAGLI